MNEIRLLIVHYSADTSTLSGSPQKKEKKNHTRNTRCTKGEWEFDSLRV